MTETNTIYQRPAELLQNLIRFDTTNPPGNEAACIAYVDGLLRLAGIEPLILEPAAGRANLVARLKGRGQAPPLLLYGHVDVVTTANQNWTYPPFEGRLVDGFVWGRGALDMKGGVAMMTAAFLRAKAEGLDLPGDVILTLVSDEEDGGDDGALFLVERHADLFQGVRYALGEFGGFTLYLGGKRFYPIMVAEKQICWMKATVRGQGGHGSSPVRGQAMARLAGLLRALDRRQLPVHITPVAQQMIFGLANGVGGITGQILRGVLNPALSNSLLALLGERGQLFAPLLHNTVSPTILRTSQKINVIPSEVSVELDGRMLPGYRPDNMLAELRRILAPEVEIEVIRHDPGPAEPNMGLFETLASILRQADPQAVVVPLLLSGVTDARFFSRLGIQTYGFLPMQLPADFNFVRTIHTADERIPVEAVTFGTNAIYQALQRFGG
jgi:acetylornithine deacetylase/succinyl-diaminopimelate desuccinylase-like protein